MRFPPLFSFKILYEQMEGGMNRDNGEEMLKFQTTSPITDGSVPTLIASTEGALCADEE
jgi:hypothetical protein